MLLLSRFSRVRLCDPIYGSPPGSPVPGILQARTLEWVAISFSNAWKWKVKVKSLSRVRLFTTPWTAAYQAPSPMGFSRQEYWSGVPLPSLKGALKDFCPQDLTLITVWIRLLIRAGILEAYFKMNFTKNINIFKKRTYLYLPSLHYWSNANHILEVVCTLTSQKSHSQKSGQTVVPGQGLEGNVPSVLGPCWP